MDRLESEIGPDRRTGAGREGAMRRSMRLSAIAVLIAGMTFAFGTGPSSAQSRAHVYLLRGLMNIFSLGMDTLAEQLNSHGVYATVHGYGDWQSLADRAAVDYKAGKEGPIILIGHSLGADAVMEMAAYLGRKGVPVALVVPFDGTQSFAASDNVARVLNLTQRDYAYMRRGPGFHGTLANIDVSSDPNIDHINIDKSPRLHARVVAEVLAVVGSHRAPAPGGPKAMPANGSAPVGQDNGNSAKPDIAPAAPGKAGNGADAGKASPVADGTPTIAAPERSSSGQAAGSPAAPPR
jgi:hypothetical protein